MTVIFCVISADIDECSLDSVNCDQLCSNSNGSYACSCRSGFVLNDNNYTCDGENKHDRSHNDIINALNNMDKSIESR